MGRVVLVAFVWIAFLCAASGCDPPTPSAEVERSSAVEAKPGVDSLPDFDKVARAEIERLKALGFTPRGGFTHELQKTGSPATILVDVLSLDVVHKGKSNGPHEVLDQAQRAKDARTLAAYRRKQSDPLATLELPHKYTVPEIAARTEYLIHLDLKYRPQKGRWVLYRCNARVKSAKGLNDKDIALDQYIIGQGYVAWRLEDLQRLF